MTTLTPDERAAGLALKRRQNLSCEQCRGSKKACDGFHLNAMVQVQSTPDNLESSPGQFCPWAPSQLCEAVLILIPLRPEQQATALLFDLQTTMMQISNKRLIMDSLLKIYHDVLESNLACWLTERTCPYTKNSSMAVLMDDHVSAQRPAALSPQSMLSSSSTNTLTLNRFYSRILRLDRAMATNNLVSLTPSQDRAASRALSQVIMALSTQWSQNVTRKERFFGRDSTPCNIEDDFFENHNETFEKDFQHATWHQAKAALLEASEIESYRVVYAEILFNWTEKPEGSDDVDLAGGWAGKNGLDNVDALFCSFSDMVDRGGPPVFIESASRKIQVLKFRLDAANIGLRKTTGARGKKSKPRDSSPPIIGPEEQATARLLYWLVVMCDNVSSSTNERPLAIKEEYCASMTSKERADTANDASFDGIQSDGLREMECFETDKPLQLDWPTTQDDAFDVLTKSVPVKVLLFRKVSSLQDALRQGNHAQTDDIIQSSIMIYRRWNVTYGAFFRKLAQMYTTLPARIKGWFICIVIPWHLAVMLMADLIDFADKSEIGQSDGRAARSEAQITSRMRRSTAIDVAELARLTCPLNEDWGGTTSTEQLPGYHYAVKSSAILTEPWTVLLIGAFRNAAVYHLGIVEDLRQNDWQALGHYPNEMREAEGRVKHCIDALWLLGRRSGMSYDLARLLSERLVAR
ncbi:hypothetical protein BKA56DRAFT_642446 [Ilyonectria sp. MPI-CAGE-AT-0026]|nr:hypothetical protein BKA56DRAFT_642446 [Ilyonectria sp. MPI-CAGE-AT-0026]